VGTHTLNISRLVPPPGKYPAETLGYLDQGLPHGIGPLPGGGLIRKRIPQNFRLRARKIPNPRQGPDILRRRALPLLHRSDKTIHHSLKATDSLLIDPFKTDFITPGGNTAPQGTFNYPKVPIVGAANPGQHISAVQYDGNTVVQIYL
jgi:hypothetical protein